MMSAGIVVFKILLILNSLKFIKCQGAYSINAPGTIQSNRKYTVCVTLHNVSQPANLRVGIRGASVTSSWFNYQLVSLQPYETKMLDFYPPKLNTSNQYELFAEGVRGLNFQSSALIAVGEQDALDIYIETDKGAYKPGDLLRFRVIILDGHVRPMSIIEPIKIQIFDAANNRVKQLKDIRLSKGVYVNEFQISKEPILGYWHIRVFIGGKYALEKKTKFEVQKYVLPKFKVYIETNKHFVVEDRYIKINVFGRYTYNKYVEGRVNLNLLQYAPNGLTILGNYTSDIVGFQAKFEIDYNDLVDLLRDYVLIVRAWLTEKQTGVVQEAGTKIHTKTERYNISMAYKEIEFRNEIPYRIKAKVQHWNDSIVNDPLTSVFMHHGGKRYESKLDDNGMATFEFDFEENANYEFWYKNSTGRGHSFLSPNYRVKSDEQADQCILKLQNESPQLNSVIEIAVESAQNIPYIVYILTSHANIIKSELVHIDSNTNSYTIQLMASYEMVPVSFLHVHYMVAGKLITCETKVELPEELENKLSVAAPKDVQPGENITMTINAQPGSRLAIVAVDLSSLIYLAANRITKAQLFNAMRRDVSYVSEGPSRRSGVLSGLVTITDGSVKKTKTIPFNSPGFDRKTTNLEELTRSNVRTDFRETWIYSDFEVTSAVTTINFKVPDSITTWDVNAFAMNEKTGIGLLDSSVQITASKTFFISTYLPYSIRRGEIVSIPIVIFNYNHESLKTAVVMENLLSEFKFVDTVSNKTTNSLAEHRDIIVPAQGGKSVHFLIYPQKLGQIDVRVKATNKLATDEILQKLTVEPDGLSTSHNHELYVSLKAGENFTTYYNTNIPEDVVPDSEFVLLSISGDVLLPSLNNLEDLVDKPTGCGEQNMIHFAPNILVLEYLRATRQTSKFAELVAKAKEYTERGYQQQLRFRHRNGGYSVFGPRGSSVPSNWLTAYVVRFFIKALKYLPIEHHIIESSLSYLANTQLINGEFANAGYLFHPAHQSRYGFTAFVLLSFLENKKYARKYRKVIEKGVTFLSNSVNNIDDIYSLAIVATAFQMAKHEDASVVLDKLRPMAKTENGLQWWENSAENRATDIEITSYILLALLHTPGQYLPIAKWLLQQRNSQGGFKSTQDTVVGLQALIKFSQLTAPQNDTLIKVLYRAISIQNEELENGVLGLDPGNVKILQQQQLPPSTRSIDIEISGAGDIFLQFSSHYREALVKRREIENVNTMLAKSFIVTTKPELAGGGLVMDLELCIRYTPLDDVKHLKTNMIIAEIDLPSGYIANEENIEEFRNDESVDRIENERPDKIILYFAYIEANERKCVNLLADQKDDVRNLKPAPIVVYEFYHSDRREVITYDIQSKEVV